MNSFPMLFSSEAKGKGDYEQPWSITSGDVSSVCAIPREFGGFGGGFSPEDLFLQAAMNCFLGTFKVVVKLSKMSFSEVQVKGTLSVDKNSENKIVMKSIALEINVADFDRPDRLEAIVAKVIRDGYILNSIKSDVTFSLSQRPVGG
jgi:organic hydroperoxide reductase OsmC/OhrA